MTRVPKNNSGSKSRAKKEEYTPRYAKQHVIIPVEDLNWALQQQPAVYKLWGECWKADGYGSRMMRLETALPRSTFMAAKKTLTAAGLFIFQRKTSTTDNRETVCWLIQNLHGARVMEYWQEIESHLPDLESHSPEPESRTPDLESHLPDLESHSPDSILPELQLQQGIQNSSVTSQQHLSNSSKEVLRCTVDSLVESPPPAAPLEGVGVSATVAGEEEENTVVVEEEVKSQESVVRSQELADGEYVSPAYDEWDLREALERCKVTNEFPGEEVLNQCMEIDYLRLQVVHLIPCHPEWEVVIEDGRVRVKQTA